MKNRTRGVLFALISGVLFGLNPLIAKTAYAGGSNAISLILVRFLVGAVLFFVLHRATSREPIRPSRKELGKLAVTTVGFAMTPVLLLTSYHYLDSGLSTTIHYVYPALVLLGGFLIRKTPPNRRSIVCCALCLLGIVCFYTPGGSVSFRGIVIAFASGAVYALYAVSLDLSGLSSMPSYKLAFWLNVLGLPLALVLAPLPALGGIHFQVSLPVLGIMALYGLQSAAATFCFQMSVCYGDAASASLLSTFEPLTSVVLGVWIYHEVLSARNAAGIVLILLSVCLVAFEGKKKKCAATADKS